MQMESTKLVAVVNSFNRLNLLKEALPSLVLALSRLEPPGAIVVYDAGSDDGSIEWLNNYAKKTGSNDPPQSIGIDLIYAKVGEDNSFAAGVNAACNFAVAKYERLEWIFLYETDNYLSQVEPLEKALGLLRQEKNLAAVGFMVEKHNGEKTGFACSFPTPFQFVLGDQLSHKFNLDRPHLRPGGVYAGSNWYFCDVVYTSPLLIKQEAWQQSKGFDAQAFPFSECDIDWSLRLQRLHWQQAVLDIDGVVHDNRLQLSSWSSRRVIQFHRARLKLLRRYYGNRLIAVLKPLLFLRHVCELILILLAVSFGYPKQSINKRIVLIKSVMNNYEEKA